MTTMPTPQAMAEYLFTRKEEMNQFVEHFNKMYIPDKQLIRLESLSPHIYMIVVNTPLIVIDGKQFLLLKVGFTHISVEKDTDNRMEDVVKQIKRKLENLYVISDPDVSILFKFKIQALDIRPFFEVEDKIREKMGFSLPTETAKRWGLPVPTEWVLTTQKHINKIKEAVGDAKKRKEVISTKIFKSEPHDNKSCDLPQALKITAEQLTKKLYELPFPLEKRPAPAEGATKKTKTTADKSPLTDATDIQTPSASGKGVRGCGKKSSPKDDSSGAQTMKYEELAEDIQKMSLTTPKKSETPGEMSGASAMQISEESSTTKLPRQAAKEKKPAVTKEKN